MATVRFEDGPCKGTRRQITEAGGLAGTTSCGGETYHLYEGSVGVFFGWVHPPASVAAPVIPLSRPARAWRRFAHQLVTETPRELRRANAAAHHLARIGRRP